MLLYYSKIITDVIFMFGFKSKRPADYVSSIDQLLDNRAKLIATKFGLDIDAIYPLCSQANIEISDNGRHLLKSVNDSDKDKVLAQYKLLIASAAVLAYELSKRPSVTFPKPSSPQTKTVQKNILSMLKKYSWQANRLGSSEQYEIMGSIFEDNLKNLESTLATGRIEIDIDATYEKLYR
jgi:hypothetical protein